MEGDTEEKDFDSREIEGGVRDDEWTEDGEEDENESAESKKRKLTQDEESLDALADEEDEEDDLLMGDGEKDQW